MGLALSSSADEGGSSVDRDEAVDLTPQYVLFEELLGVVTRAVAKLNIDWPAGKERQERPKSKLDERFLCLKSPPPCRGLPFFPICTLSCLNRGIRLIRPTSSVQKCHGDE